MKFFIKSPFTILISFSLFLNGCLGSLSGLISEESLLVPINAMTREQSLQMSEGESKQVHIYFEKELAQDGRIEWSIDEASAEAAQSLRSRLSKFIPLLSNDFLRLRGTIEVKKGDRSAIIEVQSLVDDIYEGTEFFNLTVGGPVLEKQIMIPISLTDSDNELPMLSYESIRLSPGSEGTLIFRLNKRTSSVVSFNLSIQDINILGSNALQINANENLLVVRVQAQNRVIGNDEDLAVTITNLQNATMNSSLPSITLAATRSDTRVSIAKQDHGGLIACENLINEGSQCGFKIQVRDDLVSGLKIKLKVLGLDSNFFKIIGPDGNDVNINEFSLVTKDDLFKFVSINDNILQAAPSNVALVIDEAWINDPTNSASIQNKMILFNIKDMDSIPNLIITAATDNLAKGSNTTVTIELPASINLADGVMIPFDIKIEGPHADKATLDMTSGSLSGAARTFTTQLRVHNDNYWGLIKSFKLRVGSVEKSFTILADTTFPEFQIMDQSFAEPISGTVSRNFMIFASRGIEKGIRLRIPAVTSVLSDTRINSLVLADFLTSSPVNLLNLKLDLKNVSGSQGNINHVFTPNIEFLNGSVWTSFPLVPQAKLQILDSETQTITCTPTTSIANLSAPANVSFKIESSTLGALAGVFINGATENLAFTTNLFHTRDLANLAAGNYTIKCGDVSSPREFNFSVQAPSAPTVQFASSTSSANEGAIHSIPLVISGPVAAGSVSYTISSGSEFILSHSLAADQRSINVTIKEDDVINSARSIQVALSATAPTQTVAPTNHSINIQDNDVLNLEIELASPVITEGSPLIGKVKLAFGKKAPSGGLSGSLSLLSGREANPHFSATLPNFTIAADQNESANFNLNSSNLNVFFASPKPGELRAEIPSQSVNRTVPFFVKTASQQSRVDLKVIGLNSLNLGEVRDFYIEYIDFGTSPLPNCNINLSPMIGFSAINGPIASNRQNFRYTAPSSIAWDASENQRNIQITATCGTLAPVSTNLFIQKPGVLPQVIEFNPPAGILSVLPNLVTVTLDKDANSGQTPGFTYTCGGVSQVTGGPRIWSVELTTTSQDAGASCTLTASNVLASGNQVIYTYQPAGTVTAIRHVSARTHFKGNETLALVMELSAGSTPSGSINVTFPSPIGRSATFTYSGSAWVASLNLPTSVASGVPTELKYTVNSGQQVTGSGTAVNSGNSKLFVDTGVPLFASLSLSSEWGQANLSPTFIFMGIDDKDSELKFEYRVCPNDLCSGGYTASNKPLVPGSSWNTEGFTLASMILPSTYSIEGRIEDRAGNRSSTKKSALVRTDSVAPTLSINLLPVDTVNPANISFAVNCVDQTEAYGPTSACYYYTYSLIGSGYSDSGVGVLPVLKFNGVPNNTNLTLSVTAFDLSGQSATETYNWTTNFIEIKTYTTAGLHSYVKPAGYTCLNLEVIGGGGGSALDRAWWDTQPAFGGDGARIKMDFNGLPSTSVTYDIIVGGGGRMGANSVQPAAVGYCPEDNAYCANSGGLAIVAPSSPTLGGYGGGASAVLERGFGGAKTPLIIAAGGGGGGYYTNANNPSRTVDGVSYNEFCSTFGRNAHGIKPLSFASKNVSPKGCSSTTLAWHGGGWSGGSPSIYANYASGAGGGGYHRGFAGWPGIIGGNVESGGGGHAGSSFILNDSVIAPDTRLTRSSLYGLGGAGMGSNGTAGYVRISPCSTP